MLRNVWVQWAMLWVYNERHQQGWYYGSNVNVLTEHVLYRERGHPFLGEPFQFIWSFPHLCQLFPQVYLGFPTLSVLKGDTWRQYTDVPLSVFSTHDPKFSISVSSHHHLYCLFLSPGRIPHLLLSVFIVQKHWESASEHTIYFL